MKTHRIILNAAADDAVDSIELTAAEPVQFADLEAAEGDKKTPSFTMTAYTGGMMRVDAFYHPVVVELSGVKLRNKTIPFLRDHDAGRIVGHGEPLVSAKDITAGGLISAENEFAAELIALARNGFPWEASIGAGVEEYEFVKRGEKVNVNGKSVAGPVNVIRAATLKEISFLPFGADRKTKTRITARETERSQPPAGIDITAAGNKSGLWIQGSGTTFVSAAELAQYLETLRS